jgi:hypothetical protein
MVYVSDRSLSVVISVGVSSGVTSHTKGIMQRDCQRATRFREWNLLSCREIRCGEANPQSNCQGSTAIFAVTCPFCGTDCAR